MLTIVTLTLIGLQQPMSPPEALARLQSSWTTLELDTLAVQINAAGDTPQVPGRLEIRSTYKESRNGSRRLHELHHIAGEPDSVLAYHEIDGQCYSILHHVWNGAPVEQVKVNRDFGLERFMGLRSIPAPLHVWYAGFRPLPEAIGSAEPEGERTILGRVCAVYTIQKPSPRFAAIRYALDRATGIPLEVQFFQTASAIDDDRPLMVWTTDSIEAEDGIGLPRRSHTTVYTTTGKSREEMRTEYEVQAFHRNRSLARSDFAPAFAADARVFDAFAQGGIRPSVEAYRQPQPSLDPSSPTVPPTATGPEAIDPSRIELRADQEQPASRVWMIVGITGGSLMILIAMGLRARHPR